MTGIFISRRFFYSGKLYAALGNLLHIKFFPVDKTKQEILIAQLSAAGAEGFEEGPDFLSVYFTADNYDEASIMDMIDPAIAFSKETIEPRNWNEQWEQNFEPVIVDDFCAIRAHFHQPVSSVQYDILVTPKMSFGTGHHPTTWLMINWMRELDFTAKSVLDFGTGTGVLAILALKLGAATVTAIDNDDWSIENAAENFTNNDCKNRIRLEKAGRPAFPNRFDIILANINRHVILAYMETMKQQLTGGGVILISGLLTGDREIIAKTAANNDLKIIGEKVRESWISMLVTNALE